jgi:diguanylate cyclase (GGDEF)-like protein
MNDHYNFLKGVHFFKTLSDNDIVKIQSVCREEIFSPGEVIFSEGSPGKCFFIIINGSVEVWKDYKAPNQDLLAVCEEGDAFGELSLIDDSPRSATVVAQRPSRLLSINRDDFRGVIKGSSSISLSIMKSLSSMIRDRTQSYVENLRKRNQHLETAYARLKREIEDRRQAEKQLLHQSFHDSLTSLPNRALFLNCLQSVIAKAQRNRQYAYAVLYMDIDRFSAINESLGHVAGDRILIQVAERLKNCLPAGEVIARFSGDEFAVLVEGENQPQDAVQVAQRIQRDLDAPFIINKKEIFVTACIGIVPGSSRYASTIEVLRDADITLCSAKAQGYSEYQVYDEIHRERTLNILNLETELRGAVDRKEFILKYQPIVSMETGRIAGFETLVRWVHPERGLISPGVFIPIAERTGTIVALGKWIISEACRRMQYWLKEMDGSQNIFINVNVSGKQFMHPDFMLFFKDTLCETGVPGNLIKLELTESILIENIDYLTSIFEQMKELGVRIAIDDFGTGYSSLSYLYRFPIDVLKIDRSFVVRLDSPEQRELVAIIVSIARNMKMNVVAEGVETPEQFQILHDYGCEYGQGFLFSKPVDADTATDLLSRGEPLWREDPQELTVA